MGKITREHAMNQESYEECLARVQSMANGDPTWDLSDNDRYALKAVLAKLEQYDQFALTLAGQK